MVLQGADRLHAVVADLQVLVRIDPFAVTWDEVHLADLQVHAGPAYLVYLSLGHPSFDLYVAVHHTLVYMAIGAVGVMAAVEVAGASFDDCVVMVVRMVAIDQSYVYYIREKL